MSKSPQVRRRFRRDPRQELIAQLYSAAGVLCIGIAVGVCGYYVLGQGRWSVWECVYMTIVTMSTVGFGETLPGMENDPWVRAWTLLLILLGSGALLYFASTFTAFIVEGDLRGVLRNNAMQRSINRLRDHIIVVGAGSVGQHVIEELAATKTRFVVVDNNREKLEELSLHHGKEFLFIHGDATEDDLLIQAGIERATGLVAVLHDDPENLYATVTARSLSPNIKIIAKAVEPAAVPKLKRAGADSVVAPKFIGAMRMVSEAIRPNVVEFLDVMLRDQDAARRIEEVPIGENAGIIGTALRNADIRGNTDALVIAVRRPGGDTLYNPGPNYAIEAGAVLIVLALASDIPRIREHVA
jgi:voltage-gated potassium channel